jgi:hypothetical protein
MVKTSLLIHLIVLIVETNASLSDHNGVAVIVQLLNSPEPKIKSNAEYVLNKVAKHGM